METEATRTAENAEARQTVADGEGGTASGVAAEQSVRPDGDDAAGKLAEANARADENHAKLLYALADFDNYKKRNERFLADRLAAGRRTTLAKFLSVLDNLDRALAFGQDTNGLRDGLVATQRGFEALLASEGVKPIAVVGEPFDPRVAEAIGTREAPDVPENTVLEEVQRGYAIGDELLRPARVVVSAKPSDGAAAEESGGAEAAPY